MSLDCPPDLNELGWNPGEKQIRIYLEFILCIGSLMVEFSRCIWGARVRIRARLPFYSFSIPHYFFSASLSNTYVNITSHIVYVI